MSDANPTDVSAMPGNYAVIGDGSNNIVNPSTTREPVLIVMSTLAGLQFLFGGIGATGYFADNLIVGAVGAFGALAVAAAQTGIQFFVRGQVTPVN